MTTTKQAEKPKRPDTKYKVIPNLSLKGNDILRRVNNRTLIFGEDKIYAEAAELDRISKMSKNDLMEEYRQNAKEKQRLQQTLKTTEKRRIAEEREQLLSRIAELEKTEKP